MRRAFTFPARSARTTLVVLGAWLLVLAVGGPLGAKFESVITNEPSSFLPGSAESVRVAELGKAFPDGELTPAIVVAARETGLTAADRAAVGGLRTAIAGELPPKALAPTPLIPSPDGRALVFSVPLEVSGDADALVDAVEDFRDRTEGVAADGLQVKVTGPAGFSADAIKVFGNINTTLLIATGLLVIVLLLVIYRSPVFWVLPVLAVGFAEMTVRAVGYLLGSNGVVINGQTQGILLVLVFGAGTDYALLLVARYREELHHRESARDAMRVALGQAGPAILASAGTVVAGLLVLALAEVNGTAGLGPVGAIGVAVAAISMLTALPSLLILCGRRVFWPFVPRFDASDAGLATRGTWRRIGERVTGRPRAVWGLTAMALLAMCAGLFTFDTGLTSSNGFRGGVEAVDGQELIARSFPAGATAPTTVVVGDTTRLAAVRTALRNTPGVAALGEPQRGTPGARFDLTLAPEPFSQEAYDLIPRLRDAVTAAGGDTALVGGPTAEEADVRDAAIRDTVLLPPLILLVVLVILAALLRAVLAPLLLIATVILSFLASLGLSALLFNTVFGSPGQDPTLALFGFVFLVALGVDYNIFLMARAREEAARHGTREGMLRALAVTGGVITSAGVVLAGTFAVLGVLPLWALFQIGFLVGFGVLLDTLVVRSVLVPALVADLGDRVWWPSSPRRPAGAPSERGA
ncbi:MAG: MMPL family transporter [Thermoleophilia bacterium]|nr:MMPL family transporter [Thermoleophilia bacterium]